MILSETVNRTLAGRLQRLLSGPVIIQKTKKNKLKTVDTDQRQKITRKSVDPYMDRYKRLHIADKTRTSYTAGEIRLAKLNYYQDYEAMDQDPIISSALDIYADECTVKSHKGELLEINSDDEDVKKILNNLFYDVLNIEHNLWSWVRNACKYGDFYLYLDLSDEVGITNVIPVTPYVIKREEGFDPENPYAYRFAEDGTYNSTYSTMNSATSTGIYQSHEMAHFRLLSDTNFLPYGKSTIEPARKIFKQLSLMEDAMMLVRIMRAPERRVFKINVGNLAPEEIDGYMEDVKNKMQKTPYIDRATGEYNLKYNMMNMLEDYYLPVRGNGDGTEIDTLPGLNSQGQIDDVEYLRLKEMSALKIPSAFLGYDEGVEGKATLAAEDIRFARTIERIQKTIVSELKRMAIIHLYVQGYRDEALLAFELNLTSPSIVYERQKVDLMSEQMSLASDMKDSKLFSNKMIYETVFNMSKDEWETMQKDIIKDQKLSFRLAQIEAEGNDPKVTGQSFGTAHDIAAMQMQGAEEGEKENTGGGESKGKDEERGRPKSPGSFGKHKDVNGQDPDGRKMMNKAMTGEKPGHMYKGKGALDTESVNILKMLNKVYDDKRVAITETLNDDVPDPKISFLDEEHLIEYKN